MCGIVGVFSRGPLRADESAVIERLTDMMVRRGPDDVGYWSDGRHLAFGFRRLAILDVSQRGHQPMRSQDGRYVLNFNGEVYNFRELRLELEAAGDRSLFIANRTLLQSAITTACDG